MLGERRFDRPRSRPHRRYCRDKHVPVTSAMHERPLLEINDAKRQRYLVEEPLKKRIRERDDELHPSFKRPHVPPPAPPAFATPHQWLPPPPCHLHRLHYCAGARVTMM